MAITFVALLAVLLVYGDGSHWSGLVDLVRAWPKRPEARIVTAYVGQRRRASIAPYAGAARSLIRETSY